MMGGSAGVLLLVVGLFLLVSFVTGRLDWLKRLDSDTRAVKRAAESTAPPHGQTGAAATTAGGTA